MPYRRRVAMRRAMEPGRTEASGIDFEEKDVQNPKLYLPVFRNAAMQSGLPVAIVGAGPDVPSA